eukprot:362231-Chlamydomonas_euryale.AAC.4
MQLQLLVSEAAGFRYSTEKGSDEVGSAQYDPRAHTARATQRRQQIFEGTYFNASALRLPLQVGGVPIWSSPPSPKKAAATSTKDTCMYLDLLRTPASRIAAPVLRCTATAHVMAAALSAPERSCCSTKKHVKAQASYLAKLRALLCAARPSVGSPAHGPCLATLRSFHSQLLSYIGPQLRQ